MFIVLGIVALIVVAFIVVYNGLIRSRIRIGEAWSDITVQMKRRADLIPNLIKTVKGYAKHEKSVFENVTKTRSTMLGADGPKAAAKAENGFQAALKSLFAVAEAYPDLKANENFKELQGELTDTEDKVQAARRFYNGSVRDFNTKLQVFPNNLLGGALGFKSKEFFEVGDEEQSKIDKPVDVDFDEKK